MSYYYKDIIIFYIQCELPKTGNSNIVETINRLIAYDEKFRHAKKSTSFLLYTGLLLKLITVKN